MRPNEYSPHRPSWTPCWHCHWFGYLMAEYRYGYCLLPSNHALASAPQTGCAFWTREPGTDDSPRREPERLAADSPAAAVIKRERHRLERIYEVGRRAESRLPYGIWVEVTSRQGLVGVSKAAYRNDLDYDKLLEEVERTGVNNAVRAGRL